VHIPELKGRHLPYAALTKISCVVTKPDLAFQATFMLSKDMERMGILVSHRNASKTDKYEQRCAGTDQMCKMVL
jgi:hypothetical protein